ncbi:MAG: NADH:flavin oxidoreductase, partial [Caulobacteraceae bacterium]|nr:NADH:flavin oxidoreductase [Caulobacteraceae bacterium]
TEAIFSPFSLGDLTLRNRIVMAAMTQCTSPDQIPSEHDIAYYVARAKGGVGLIMAGATTVEERSGSNEDRIPAFFGERPLQAWVRLKDRVQAEGCKIMPQLFHCGATRFEGTGPYPDAPVIGPSGLAGPGRVVCEPMSQAQIDACVEAYGKAAYSAKALGFDGVEIHAAHGYFIDQFFWDGTNQRTDGYGGSIEGRSRFATEIVQATRHAVGPDFPIVLRFSQWKIQDYSARLVTSPAELERFLRPLIEAGVDILHASGRRYWDAEFPETKSPLTLAGWTRKISGLPTIAVGSVGLKGDIWNGIHANADVETGEIDRLNDLIARGEFDLIAIGRALLANPDWAEKVRRGAYDTLQPYYPAKRDDYASNTGYDH